MPEQDQTPSLWDGGSKPKVEKPDTRFSGDLSTVKTLQKTLPKYQGINPVAFKRKLVEDEQYFDEVVTSFFNSQQPQELRSLSEQDPEQYQQLSSRFKNNFRKDLVSSSYAGESEKDTLVNRTISMRGSVEDIDFSSYKSVVEANPKKYEKYGLFEDKKFVFGDDRNDSIAFSKKVVNNDELHQSIVQDQYSSFQDAVSKTHNNPNLLDDPTTTTQAWVVYDNFGSEGLTQFFNSLQRDDQSESITERMTGSQQAKEFFAGATVNGKRAPEAIEEFVMGGEEPLTFRPITPKDELTKQVPDDFNAYTRYGYETEGDEMRDKDWMDVSKEFLKKFSPENYKKFQDPNNLSAKGEFSDEFTQLAWNVYEQAVEGTNFTLQDLMDTVKVNSTFREVDGKPHYSFNYEELPPKAKIALNALRNDREAEYMIDYAGDGQYDFRPKRRETSQEFLDTVKSWVYNTKDELYRDEDGELQKRTVPETGGFAGMWNSVATVGLGAADWVNRFFFEPAARGVAYVSKADGAEAFASSLKDYTGVDLATGLSSETDGIVPNAIGEVTPFVQYIGAMMVGGSGAIRAGSSAFSGITKAKKALDVGRYASKMQGASRWQAMSQKLAQGVKNKEPWARGAGVFYSGGGVVEATQPKEVSFMTTVPELLGYEPTNDIAKLYKTASDEGRVAMDIGASLVMDSFFDTAIAGSKFLSGKAGKKYFDRKDFKGIRYREGDDTKFGGYRVVDEPQFRHDIREFWANLTSDLERIPVGNVGESMAKSFTKNKSFKTLHDFSRQFVDDSEYVASNIKSDIEDNIRYINRTLAKGDGFTEDQIKTLVDEQYNNFLDSSADQIFGVLRQQSADLPLRFAQTLDEQMPTVKEFRPDGKPISLNQLENWKAKDNSPKLIAKGGKVFEIDPKYWTIDLAQKIRTKSINETKESVIKRKLDNVGDELTEQKRNQIRDRYSQIGQPVTVEGKVGYVVDIDDTAGYTVRTVDGDITTSKLASEISDEQFEQQVRTATNNKIVQQKLMLQGDREVAEDMVKQITPKTYIDQLIQDGQDIIKAYEKRFEQVADQTGKTINKQLNLPFC